jgi:hypothetical protein
MIRQTRPGVIEISGPSFHALANDTVLTFSPPMIDLAQNPDGFVYHWKHIQRVFNLPDPNAFPPLGSNVLPAGDQALIDRYIETAKHLAASSLIGTKAKGGNLAGPDGKPNIMVADFPTREVVAGFSVMFRQLYSTQEQTHFAAIAKIIGRANENADDGAAAQRRVLLKAWRSAHGRLHADSLDKLLGLQLEKEGKWASRMTPRLHDLTPQELISMYLYGDLIHWETDKRQKLTAFRTENEISAVRELDYLKALIALSHIYIGYAVLAQAATSGVLFERP